MSVSDTSTYPTVNLGLARRLERAEAMANVAYVETRRELDERVGASWIQVAGAHALFDGISSPLTQTFGLGIFEPARAHEFERLEAFFAERGAPTSHEVSSLASHEVWDLLSARGYTPIETSTVLVRSTSSSLARPAGSIVARVIQADESRLWARIMTQGMGDDLAEAAASIEQLGSIIARTPGVHCFLAELGDQAIASGILNIRNGVALLGGASTVPSARRRGAQSVLLQARLDLAAGLGVGLAMMVAGPGGTSQRNAERHGFRPVYVRSKWQLNRPLVRATRGA